MHWAAITTPSIEYNTVKRPRRRWEENIRIDLKGIDVNTWRRLVRPGIIEEPL